MTLKGTYEAARRAAILKEKEEEEKRLAEHRELQQRSFEQREREAQDTALAKENAYGLLNAISPLLKQFEADNIEVQLYRHDHEWSLHATYYKLMQSRYDSSVSVHGYAAAACTIRAAGFYFGHRCITELSDAAEAFVKSVGRCVPDGLSRAELHSKREWKSYREADRKLRSVVWSSWG